MSQMCQAVIIACYQLATLAMPMKHHHHHHHHHHAMMKKPMMDKKM